MSLHTVLGARGFIGSHLLASLEASAKKTFAPARDDPSIFTHDLGTVYYCIGLTNDYKDRPFDTVEAHTSLLNRLMEKATFKRLVYLSSTRLYDSTKGTVSHEDVDLALNPFNPRHIYDLSKALGENICLMASVGRACAARLSSVYSTDDAATGFMPDLLRRLKKERSFTIDSTTGIVRDYIHIDDVIRALIKLGEQSGSDIYNVASGRNISNKEIADCLDRLGYNVKMACESSTEVRPVCDITKLKSLGIVPLSVPVYLEKFIKEARS